MKSMCNELTERMEVNFEPAVRDHIENTAYLLHESISQYLNRMYLEMIECKLKKKEN